ncbi:putative O-methyltransferase YrrM [Bradyrhizobium sp. JR3.5]
MTTLISPELAGLLDRLFAQASAADEETQLAVADLSEAEQARLTRSKTEYRALYGRLNNVPLAVSRETGALLYMLAHGTRARNIVEFGTSFGISTLHLAAALRDNGGGRLITSEFEPSKVARARDNLVAGRLEDLVEIREGDALKTLRTDLPDTIDLVLLDGAKALYPDILDLVERPPEAGRLRRRRQCRPQPRLSGTGPLAGERLFVGAVRRRRRAVDAAWLSGCWRSARSGRLDLVDDGGPPRALWWVGDVLETGFEVAKDAAHFPFRLPLGNHLHCQFLGLVGITEIKGRGKLRRAQPFVGKLQSSGPLAGGNRDAHGGLRKILVARVPPSTIETGQVAGAIIGVEIELHTLLITVDRLLQLLLAARRVGRCGSGEAFVAATHQPEPFRRRPREINQCLDLGNGLDVVAGLGRGKCTIFLHFRFVGKAVGKLANEVQHDVPVGGIADAVAQHQQQS